MPRGGLPTEAHMTTKLYCYVDESGQDTSAQPGRVRVFVVAVAIFEENRDELERACEDYEKASGKKRRKWNSCERESKMTYLRMVIEDVRFRGALCYSVTHPIREPDYDARTILGIAKVVQWKHPAAGYSAEIYIDGLTTAKRAEYSLELRKLGVCVRRVHLARDESYALIRLADALAGLAREVTEGNEGSAALMRQAMRRGIVAEV
jgi:hypothetical protein